MTIQVAFSTNKVPRVGLTMDDSGVYHKLQALDPSAGEFSRVVSSDSSHSMRGDSLTEAAKWPEAKVAEAPRHLLHLRVPL